MVWNASLPANATKIREAPEVIQDNWAAIETGDSTFQPQQINFKKLAGNASLITDVMVSFCTNDTAMTPKPQLYAIDPDGNVNTLTPLIPTVTANGFLQLPGGLQMLWGTTGGAAGTKTFHTPFTTALFNLQVTILDNNARSGSVKILTKTNFVWTPDTSATTIHYFAIGN